MNNPRDLADFARNAGEMAGRNRIINGGFDIWQRGTSFTATGYTADRWRMALGSALPAESVESVFDRLTIIAQRIKTLVERSFRLSDAAAASGEFCITFSIQGNIT